MNEIERMQRAADWLQQLSAAGNDEKLIEEWLEWCSETPENLGAFEKAQEVWLALSLPEGRRTTALPQRTRRQSMVFVGLAASVLVMMATGWWQLASWREQVQTLTTTVAEQGSQLLADGSQVDMGARTRIVARYTRSIRAIALEEGEAYFNVSREADRPFVVDAGSMRITAVGTAFNVRRANDRTTVVVSEGTVRIEPGAPQAMRHELRASAGEQVTFLESSNEIRIGNVDPALATSWRKGVLTFVGEPLGSVVSSVNRYSMRPIEIADEALANQTFTGTVYVKRTDEWLEALEYVLPLEVSDDGSGPIRLERRR